MGISFGAGNGSAGLSIFASVNGAKGKDSGNGTQWSETTLDSGGNVLLNSGRDTTLTGAQVNGDKVSADVGRNLTITSQQDSDRYDSKQTSFGAGGSFTFGSMTASGYINASQDKMRSTYDSVMEQSGIYAGKGGFDIQVGEHTQLNGAVIASQATADKNRLETGTLGFSDLGNEADYKVSHAGISAGMSNGGSMGGQMLGNVLSNSASTLLAGLNGKGHAEGTTRSAVEQGTIVIRDTANQQQNVDSLSRDTATANGSISPIFDKEKEQKRLQAAQAVGEITGQMVSIVNTIGDIKGLEEAKKSAKPLEANVTEKDRADWLEGLRKSDAYQKAMSDYGVGSKNQMVVQAVSGVLQGLVNGSISQAVAGAANPLVAQVIKAQTTDASGKTNVAANAMAHAVWGAVAAQMSGGNAAAGAAGAFSGELATRFIAEAFSHASTPEDIAKLSQADKEQLSLMGTIAAGAAGAMAGNSSAAATTGALAGKNAVENNALSPGDFGKGMADYSQSVASYAQYAQDNNLPPEQVKADMERMVKGDLPEGADIIKAILSNNPGSDTVMALLEAKDAKDYALALLTSIPAERVLALVGKAAKVIDNKILISAAEKISTAKPGKQSPVPRDLNEQIVWKQVQENPAKGDILPGMNNDPRFPASAGFQKMQVVQKKSKGESITVHYQYNSTTGKSYDMKIDTPQRVSSNLADVIENIKGQVK